VQGPDGLLYLLTDNPAGRVLRLAPTTLTLIHQVLTSHYDTTVRAPRRGAEGMVAFIHPRASGGVLIELIDRASLRDSIP